MVVLGLAHGGEKQYFEVFVDMERANSREVKNYVYLGYFVCVSELFLRS